MSRSGRTTGKQFHQATRTNLVTGGFNHGKASLQSFEMCSFAPVVLFAHSAALIKSLVTWKGDLWGDKKFEYVHDVKLKLDRQFREIINASTDHATMIEMHRHLRGKLDGTEESAGRVD